MASSAHGARGWTAPPPSSDTLAQDPYGWLFAVSLVALLIRVMLVPSSIMMSDEYYYAKTAHMWFLDHAHLKHITPLPARGEAEFPNALFFSLYRITYVFGENFYIAAKLLNVALAGLMALLVRDVARRFVDGRAATAIAALVLWLPASTYYAYFVPEPLYELLVWGGLAGYFLHLERKPELAVALLGACLGAAFLAKPNAVALLAAANAVVVVTALLHRETPFQARRLLTKLLILNIAFLGAAYLTNLIASGSFVWDPVGKFYRTGLSKLGELDAQASFIHIFADYSGAYLLALGFLLGPPLIVLAVRATRLKGSLPEIALLAMSVIGITVLLLGSAKAATNWERVYVNHTGIYSTRYMSVLFPLLVIAFVRFLPDTREPRVQRLVSGLLVAGMVAGLALVHRHMANTFQMREVMWPRELHRWGYRLAIATSVAVTAFYAMRRRPGIAVYAWALALASVFGTITITRRDMILARAGYPGRTTDIARALVAVVPAAEQDHGLIVAPDNHTAAHFMFQYPGVDSLIVTSDLRTVTLKDVPPDITWVIFLGDADPHFSAACIPLRAGTYCPLTATALRAPGAATGERGEGQR